MQVIQVADKKTVNEFHKLPYKIYKNDYNWVPPLQKMHEDIFNPRKNSGFKNGDARRWIVKTGEEVVGRIAAFYEHGQTIGAVGFFECVNDKDVSILLFDTAREWLKNNDVEAMDGPVNFGVNFFNWGLLAEGFRQQSFGMQYHPPYYKDLFELYGFQVYYKQFTYRKDISNPDLPERFWKIAARVAKKSGLSFERFKSGKKNKYIDDFIKVYSQAWRNHSNFKPMNPYEIRQLLKQAKPVIDEEFLWYAYLDGEPVAFLMMIPDLNQILKKMNSGSLGLTDMIKFFLLKRKKTMTRCRVMVLGVVPKYQRSGIESGIFHQLKQVMLRRPWYTEMEMSWIGDFNPKMNALFKSVGATHEITHYTMRYQFEREKPFDRMPIISE